MWNIDLSFYVFYENLQCCKSSHRDLVGLQLSTSHGRSSEKCVSRQFGSISMPRLDASMTKNLIFLLLLRKFWPRGRGWNTDASKLVVIPKHLNSHLLKYGQQTCYPMTWNVSGSSNYLKLGHLRKGHLSQLKSRTPHSVLQSWLCLVISS